MALFERNGDLKVAIFYLLRTVDNVVTSHLIWTDSNDDVPSISEVSSPDQYAITVDKGIIQASLLPAYNALGSITELQATSGEATIINYLLLRGADASEDYVVVLSSSQALRSFAFLTIQWSPTNRFSPTLQP